MRRRIFLLFAIVSLVGMLAISGGTNKVFGQSGTLNGHEYVDLGLPSGTKWAKCNIGAANEIDYGDYYAFAETSQKGWEYTKGNYKVDKTIRTADSSYIDKDGFTHTFIGKDIFNIAGTLYDVATVKWGKGWRMPTKEQFDELKNNCKWEWVSKNGYSYGYKVTGTNGNYIFLPAASYRDGHEGAIPVYVGHYWFSSIDTDNTNFAWYFYFDSDCHYERSYYRYRGQSVRPVCTQ